MPKPVLPGSTKLHNKRQREILELVQSRGFVSSDELARTFHVTTQTVRRDINLLCREGLLRRHHGGAGLPATVENIPYSTRQVICLDEKIRIARMVASHIPDQTSLFINIGTTTEEVAKALRDHRGLRIITNNLNVAAILSQNGSFEIIVAGGVVRHRDRGITGDTTIEFIEKFKVDFGIIGISGIDMDGSLLDFDYSEVRVAQAIMVNSHKVFLATDSTKFGRKPMVRLGQLSQIDALFTDKRPPDEICRILADANVKLHIALNGM
ncbi:MAG: DeoR family transcriptional regulator [bacterium]|nr:DeoR family transcriptional regulator [bacterium]